MKHALAPLQFVEQDSIQANIRTRKVVFAVKDKTRLDLSKVTEALAAEGFSHVTVVSAPSPAATRKGLESRKS